MKKLDWKSLGQFLSVFLNLFSVIRDTFAKMGVGIEVTGWLVGEGKEIFIKDFLRPLGERFLATQKPKTVRSVMVDLGAFPKLPFDGASVLVHSGTGKVKLERRGEELFLDGRKIILHFSERQKNDQTIKGYELREELSGKPVLNANVLDALYEHPELIPESWKLDEQGKVRFIFFWGTIYSLSDGTLYVRYLCLRGGVWDRLCHWLDDDWDGGSPAALLSS